MTEQPKTPTKEIMRSDAIGYQILINLESRGFELVYDADKTESIEATFTMMILLRKHFQNLLDREQANALIVGSKKYNPKLVMTKTEQNKHKHTIELFDKYVKELAQAMSNNTPEFMLKMREKKIKEFVAKYAPAEYQETPLDKIPIELFDQTQLDELNKTLELYHVPESLPIE